MALVLQAQNRWVIRDDVMSPLYAHLTHHTHTFKECDLDFINAMEKLLPIAMRRFPSLVHLKPNHFTAFEFIANLTHPGYSLIAMDLSMLFDTIEMMYWKIFSDGFLPESKEPIPNRVEHPTWVKEALQLFTIVQLRCSSLMALRQDPDVLNVQAYVVPVVTAAGTAGAPNLCEMNAFCIRDLGALLDELTITFYRYEKPTLPVFKAQIPDSIKKALYSRYLQQYPLQKVCELYEKECCERMITRADYFINVRKFNSYTKYAPDVLRVKGGERFPDFKNIKIEQLWETPLFVDFIFTFAYRQRKHAEITTAFKNRLYNVWIDKETKQTYGSIADYIYTHYLDVVTEDGLTMLGGGGEEEEEEDEDDTYIRRELNQWRGGGAT